MVVEKWHNKGIISHHFPLTDSLYLSRISTAAQYSHIWSRTLYSLLRQCLIWKRWILLISFFLNGVAKLIHFCLPSQGLKDAGIELFFCLGCISIGTMWPFYLCQSGTAATFAIGEIGTTVNNSNWYDYPPKVRKYIILMIAQSQIPICFTGFKIMQCSLEVFMRVCTHKMNRLMIEKWQSECWGFHSNWYGR